LCPVFEDRETGRVEDGLVRVARLPDDMRQEIVDFPMPDFRKVDVRLAVAHDDGGNVGLDRVEAWCDYADEDDRIAIVSAGANGSELRVQAPDGPRWLLFTEAHYPGWTARVNGAPAPIERANDVFQAVRVPTGEHTVEFLFRPKRVFAGVAISLMGYMVGALILGSGRRTRKTA